MSYLPKWLSDGLKFKKYHDDTLPVLWLLLGENEKWVQLVSELHIRFEEGCLCLATGFEHDPSEADKATSALLHLWRFRAAAIRDGAASALLARPLWVAWCGTGSPTDEAVPEDT